MAVGSGVGASLGAAPEVTYGTYVAPTKFYEFQSEDIKKQITFVQGGGLAAGAQARRGTRRKNAAESAAGSVTMDVPNKSFGLILQALMGTTVTPVQQAATIAYLQTHPAADNFGKNLTLQKGVPQTDGTVRVYSYLGGKVTGAEFSCGVGELLNAKIDFDFRKEDTGQTLSAPSYSSTLDNWSFNDMTLKLGTYGAEAAVSGVTKVTVNIERPMKLDRQYAGAAGLKAEPISNDFEAVKITGTVEADFLDKTVFADRFSNNTSTSMVLEFVGPVAIESTYFPTFRITVPIVFFDGDSPTVSGPDVVSGSFPFVGLWDGTNAVATIAYMSTDTTV